MAKGGKKTLGDKPKGTAKHKGAKGHSYKRKDKNKVKSKSKTINRNLDKRPQRIAIAKATRSNASVERNQSPDEAAPAATSDTGPVSE